MRVLMIFGDPMVETYGGVENHVEGLTKALSARKDIELQTLDLSREAALDHIRFGEGSSLARGGKASSIVLPMLFMLNLVRIILTTRKKAPDVVHFQTTHPLYVIAALLIQKRVAVVLTIHGYLQNESIATGISFTQRLSVLIEKLGVMNIKNLIVVAPQIGSLVSGITDSNVYMVPNGVDLEMIDGVPQQERSYSPRLVFVGNLKKIKGVHVLLKALALVHQVEPDVNLVIIGKGPEERSLKELVTKNGLQNNVSFLGFISGEKKISILKSAQMQLVPSLWESLPIVILEGMACGKPIVASRIGGIPYVIHEGINGFLVEPGDTEQIAARILELLQDEGKRVKMGNASHEMAKEFLWEKVADKTIAIYFSSLKWQT